ncbi:Lathosterol oxidase [Quaeritorhiza haematococci]|nr:Lathosterol oxidase [Quaeritorhiza haematococci]
MQTHLSLILFVAVQVWTVNIHDNLFLTKNNIINGAAHHTIHHLEFNYNYGQYFTFWDRIFGTHRFPTPDKIDAYLDKLLDVSPSKSSSESDDTKQQQQQQKQEMYLQQQNQALQDVVTIVTTDTYRDVLVPILLEPDVLIPEKRE